MNELKLFENPEFGSIRVIEKDGEPWFVLSDVCKVLGLTTPARVAERLEDDEKGVSLIHTLGGEQRMTIINEAGLYSVILRSDKALAKPFKRWITHEVIPTIRKHGAYMTDDVLAKAIENPDFAIGILNALKAEKEKNKELVNTVAVQKQQISELQPKASYYDLVLNCKDLLSMSEIAKDYGKSAKWMNKWLHEHGIQFKQGKIWLLYQKYAEKGYTSTKTHTYNGNDGSIHSEVHTYWTQAGRLFIYDTLKDSGILPLIERKDGENDD